MDVLNIASIQAVIMTIRSDYALGNTHHSKSIEIVPEFRLAAVMGYSTYKYLL